MHKLLYWKSSACLNQTKKVRKMKFFVIIAFSVALCMAAPAEDAQILRYEVSSITFWLFICKDKLSHANGDEKI